MGTLKRGILLVEEFAVGYTFEKRLLPRIRDSSFLKDTPTLDILRS